MSDGVVTLRAPQPVDTAELIAGRDDEFRRFLGEGSPTPAPTAVLVDTAGAVIGWIDYDRDRAWLDRSEVNIGYNTLPAWRGRGMAQRAVELLVGWLSEQDDLTTATLLIDPENLPSLRVAAGTGFERAGDIDGQRLFKRMLRPEATGARQR